MTNLTVNPTYNISENKTICNGQNYNGWTTSGIYKRTLQAKAGCDSIVTTNLTVNPTYNISENKTICNGQNYNGWTTSGIYKRTLQAKAGCDSIVTTNLTVNPTYNISENITICNGQNYNGWTTSGTYKRTLQAKAGCDSVVTTVLLVNPVFQPEIILSGDTLKSKNIYSTYQWIDSNGIIPGATKANYIIEKSGKYYIVVTDNNGCDQYSTIIDAVWSEYTTYKNDEFQYSVYPNPNTGYFEFRVESACKEEILLKLINLTGSIIKEKILQNNSEVNSIQFDTSHLSKGIYLLVVSTGTFCASEKIIVQ
jgi:hypothetical protein